MKKIIISIIIIFIILFFLVRPYFIDTVEDSKLNSSPDVTEFYNGKDVEIVKITSNHGANYCVLILSSTGVPLSKGRVYFDKSRGQLKEALDSAHLNPNTPWWSFDLYHKSDLNYPYANLPIIPYPNCDNGGLTLDIIESRPPFYFIAIKFADREIHRLGFIKSENMFDKSEFDFVLLDVIYLKNNNKFELLSCEMTNFGCSDKKYLNPYQYVK